MNLALQRGAYGAEAKCSSQKNKGAESKMLTFLSIIAHPAADCLVHNESIRK